MAGGLYARRRVLAFEIPNTAHRQRIATELAVLSDEVVWPQGQRLLPRGRTWWVRGGSEHCVA